MSADNQGPETSGALDVRPGDVIFHSAQAVAHPNAALMRWHDSGRVDITPFVETFAEAFGALPGTLGGGPEPVADALFILEADDPGATSGSSADAGAGGVAHKDDASSGDASGEDTPGGEVIAVRLGLMTSEAVANHLPELADKLTKPKVFFSGGASESVVLALGLVDATSGDTSMSIGEGGRVLYLSIADDAPEIAQQVAAAGAGELQGLRLFHSFVRIPRAHLAEWLGAGIVSKEPAQPEDVFTTKPAETWRRIMARRPFPENLFSTWAQYPERN